MPSKDYKEFTASLKKIYRAASAKAAAAEFESFKKQWEKYPGAVAVWERNIEQVMQLFDYGSAVRKIMYTTNAVESIHASFRKVTRKGSFVNEEALLKLLYLRIKELYKKWTSRPAANWSLVRNQPAMNDKIQIRIAKFEHI